MAVVNAMLPLPAQPLHPLHQRAGIPHLNLLGTHAGFQPLAPQPRRYRIDVLLHLNRAALAHPHPLTLLRLQATLGQPSQPLIFLSKRHRPARIPPGHQRPHEGSIVVPAGEVPTATQAQFLVQGFLETAMTLLTITVLVSAVRIGGLRDHPVVPQQRLIAGGVLFGVAVVMHRQRHAVGAVPLGNRAQFPHGVLQPRAEAGEAFREADRHRLPVRAGQHEVVQQMGKRLPPNRHL